MFSSQVKFLTFSMTTLFCSFFVCNQAHTLILLDDVMSRAEQTRTGISTLNHIQKYELEVWLNENMDLKPEKAKRNSPQLSVEENISNGQMLRLSDNSLYQIAPSDALRASMWLTPFPVEIISSNNVDYPVILINKNTGERLLAKPIAPYAPSGAPNSPTRPATGNNTQQQK